MLNFLKKKLNPASYQGGNNPSQHFEGWYFKLIDKDERHLYAVIPGIFISTNPADSHAFIQIFDGVRNQSYYYPFPIEAFRSDDHSFKIQINSNHFSSDQLVLDLESPSFKIDGELQFTNLTKWPKTVIAPGAMDWYTWVPFMECYHGVISLNHTIQGSLSINGHTVDFSNGHGYIEKDWGKSFPEAWIWCQSNHFNTENTSITGTIAIIPWIRKPFLGFIFGLWHKDKLYRFTTYTGAKLIHFEMDDHKLYCILKQKRFLLEIIADRAESGSLQAPTLNGMMRRISETIQSTIEIKLSQQTKTGNEIILNDTGRHAGFEIAGDLQRLFEMVENIKAKESFRQ